MDESVVEEVEESEVAASAPWYNNDTVSSSLMFASLLADAASKHFAALATLAAGQSALDWGAAEKKDFIELTLGDISGIKEAGGAND